MRKRKESLNFYSLLIRQMTVIRDAKGMANKDLARFADQINALCDKWKL